MVAITGTRQTISSINQVVTQLVQALSCTVVTGCAKGVDNCAFLSAKGYGVKVKKLISANQTPQALRARTKQVVGMSNTVFAFPHSLHVQYSGTWLSVGYAIKLGKPVFVYAPQAQASSLPLCWGVSSWQQITVNGVGFWQPVTSQLNLFN